MIVMGGWIVHKVEKVRFVMNNEGITRIMR